MVNDLRSNVELGARMLDKQRPGWHRNIDVDALDQRSTRNCVLGQTFGDYYDGITSLYGETEASEACLAGFTIDPFTTYPRGEVWDALNKTWKFEIKGRLREEAQNETLAEPVTDPGPTFTLTADQLLTLVTEAMDAAPTRGAYSEIGLVADFVSRHNLRG